MNNEVVAEDLATVQALLLKVPIIFDSGCWMHQARPAPVANSSTAPCLSGEPSTRQAHVVAYRCLFAFTQSREMG